MDMGSSLAQVWLPMFVLNVAVAECVCTLLEKAEYFKVKLW